MHAQVYQFDMSNPGLVIALCFNPSPGVAADAWNQGLYSLAYEFDISDELSEQAALELVFRLTQDTGTARSTSVGDIFIIGEGQQRQAFMVQTVGFSVVTI